MSLLKKANEAFRNKDYESASDYYLKAQAKLPELKNIIEFNLKLIEKKSGKDIILPELEEIKKLPLTVLVITWDVGHNPLGRSYMLAEAMTRSVRNVVLAGFQFPRFGNDVWEPVREGSLPVIALPGKNFPEIIDDFEHIVEKFQPDVVVACKPRLPSVELGVLFKEKYGIPLIVDVDDHELSFFKDAKSLTIEELKDIPEKNLEKEVEPYEKTWTRLTDHLCKYADEIIVSNIALHREFGGTILPHVRNEQTFNPSLFNKLEQRQKYGVPEKSKVVMFFGTPRHHKGVNVLAEAIGKIEDDTYCLVVVGNSPDKSVTAQLDKLSKGKVIYLPNQPFSAIPEIIVMADIICLPQDEGHAISQYQLPAKAIDAIGMSIPLFVSKTEPLMQLVNDGVAKVINSSDLSEVIQSALQQEMTKLEKLELRKRFLKNYSYHAAALSLKNVIERALKNKRKSLDGFSELLKYQKKLFPILKTENTLNLRERTVDIVVFWKQNDTGLYGRRSDMVIKYLASREDVRKVIVFDAPISEYDLLKMKESSKLTQGRKIYEKTYEKLLGKYDTDKVSFNVFAHSPGIYTNNYEDKSRKPIFDGYSKYIDKVLNDNGVVAKESIFWFYPKNYLSNEILDYFEPTKVVVDVVDDHRAWPGVSDIEKKKLTEHYKSILQRADMAFANCQPVIDSMKQFNKNIKLVPNGCEDNPVIIEPKNHAMYNELKNFNGKVIGFVGNLEAKIDIELIEKIAEKFSDALIVLVGSTHANPKVRELRKYKNIRMFGVIPYKNVNAIVSKFNVGIVPHKQMDLTDNMNPLKVFVYLSNYIPVVTTCIQNLPKSEAILVSNNSIEFINNIKIVLENKLEIKNTITSFVSENSWSTRFGQHLVNLKGWVDNK